MVDDRLLRENCMHNILHNSRDMFDAISSFTTKSTNLKISYYFDIKIAGKKVDILSNNLKTVPTSCFVIYIYIL